MKSDFNRLLNLVLTDKKLFDIMTWHKFCLVDDLPKEKGNLRGKSGIYALYDENIGEILYIGKAKSLYNS